MAFFPKKSVKINNFLPKAVPNQPRTRSDGGRRDNSRLSSCLPLTREVANPKGLTEGEMRRAYAERDAQSGRVANSLPQSPAATAPSSEGAKGWGVGAARSEGAKGLVNGRLFLLPLLTD